MNNNSKLIFSKNNFDKNQRIMPSFQMSAGDDIFILIVLWITICI